MRKLVIDMAVSSSHRYALIEQNTKLKKKVAFYKDLLRQVAFVLRPWLARPKVLIDRRDLSSQEIPVEQKCMVRATTTV